MDAIKTQTSGSFLSRLARGFGRFEQAMEMRPVDVLELRVADLERRLAAPISKASESRLAPAPNRRTF